MRKLKNNLFKKILTAILIVLAVLPVFPPASRSHAAALTAMSDTMTRLQTSTLSSHDIAFTLQGANTLANGDTVTIDFDEDGGKFTVANSGWVVGDFDLNDGTERVIFGIVQGAATQTPDCTGSSGANDVAVAVETDTGKIKFKPCTSYSASSAAATVDIQIGTAATTTGTGVNRITNPSSNGSTTIPITETTDSGTLAVPIMTADQVTVSATVDPSITSTLSSSTCSLGTLSVSATAFCSYTNTINTNASTGYASTIFDDGNLRSAGGDDINDAAGDNDVDTGSEEYGVGTSKATQTITQYTTCANNNPQPAKALTTSPQQYANATGPVSADVTTLCHAASVAGTTPAGSYSHIVTHITTGTF